MLIQYWKDFREVNLMKGGYECMHILERKIPTAIILNYKASNLIHYDLEPNYISTLILLYESEICIFITTYIRSK